MDYKEFILLSEDEREELKNAYNLIHNIKEKMSVDFEEYSAIKTSLAYLNNAINYKDKFLT